MTGASKRDIADLTNASAAAAKQVTELTSKLNEVTKGLDGLGVSLKANSERGARPTSDVRAAKVTKGQRFLNALSGVVPNWIGALTGIAALIVAMVMIVPTLRELDVAVDAAQRDQISQSFSTDLERCVSLDSAGFIPGTKGTTVTSVLTNTGRLPITILDFVSDLDEDPQPIKYAWVGFDTDAVVQEGGPIRLDVGDAVAVRAFVPGDGFEIPFRLTLSNGSFAEKANFVEYTGEFRPALVEESFGLLPEFCRPDA